VQRGASAFARQLGLLRTPGLDVPPGGRVDDQHHGQRGEAAHRATTDELAALAEAAIEALASGGDPAAFGHLLRLTRVAGEAVGVAARTMADHTSWTGVAQIAGTSRQAAWERWRDR